MCNYHPDINTLLEYASGALPPGPALAVAAHLHYCDACRHNVNQLTLLGVECFEDLEPEHDIPSFDVLMNTIDNLEESHRDLAQPTVQPTISHSMRYNLLPNAVKALVPKFADLKWKRLGKSISATYLSLGQSTHEVALHKIKAGAKAPKHDHSGSEYTVILSGSFSDEDGLYQKGDFIHNTKGHVHTPVAGKSESCLCLTVVDAPIKLTGFLGCMVNPFLKTNAA